MKHHGHGHGSNKGTPIPRILAWEITRSCNLSCLHCRAAANCGPYEGELSTEECKRLLDTIASFAKPIIILTGGEPMLRTDIYEIASYGTSLGLRMVMAPCGSLLTKESCQKLIDAGIQRISLSIDGKDAESHDTFRGEEGAFASVMSGIEAANSVGLDFQINTTITKLNVKQLPEIFSLAAELGAVSFHPFLLVPTGRGKALANYEIEPEKYEEVLHWFYEQRGRSSMTIKPTCAPHYYRILRQREKEAGRIVTPETHGLDAITKGCLGGQGFGFISHVGKVQMCGFLEEEAGDIRESQFNFEHIWNNSPFFAEIRNTADYVGKCGVCEYTRNCGGCRARAFAMSGNYLEAEPFCVYTPAKMTTAL